MNLTPLGPSRRAEIPLGIYKEQQMNPASVSPLQTAATERTAALSEDPYLKMTWFKIFDTTVGMYVLQTTCILPQGFIGDSHGLYTRAVVVLN